MNYAEFSEAARPLIRRRRLGKFRVANAFLEPENDCVRRLMAKVIVLDIVRHWNFNSIEYVAQCDDFEWVPEGEVLPEYEVICSGDPVRVNFVRIDEGRRSSMKPR